MRHDFIPGRQAELLTWSGNFSAHLSADPAGCGVSLQQAADYALLHENFAALFQQCASPANRTPAGVVGKNLSKQKLIDAARALARLIHATASVSAERKSELGLAVRNPDPTPIARPDRAPAIDIVSVQGRTVSLRLHDSLPTTRRGKPAGIAGTALFSFVGPNPPADPQRWHFELNTGRMSATITFDPALPPGTPIWLIACWFNPRQQRGPLGHAVNTFLAGGGSMAA
jgi:hypothetical protein